MEEAQCSSHYLGNNRTKENGLQACRAPCPVHSLGLGLIISNMPRGTGTKNTLLCEILLHKAAVLHRLTWKMMTVLHLLSQLFLCHLKGLGLIYVSVLSPTLSFVSVDEMHLIQP